MGVWVRNNPIDIAEKTHHRNKVLSSIGYNDIDRAFLRKLKNEEKIKYVQISGELPSAGYKKIDKILAIRPDITFRIYGLYNYAHFDLSFLQRMPHLHRPAIDCHLRDTPDLIDFNLLTTLKLKTLKLDAFDLRDYSFIQHLSEDLEELLIMADTTGAKVNFDCSWLLRYHNLRELWLGKKAKKNIACLKELEYLKALHLRGIKLSDFTILEQMQLEKLSLLWNSNSDLHALSALKTLKEIKLWRINKLSDVSFLAELTDLEQIKLKDLKHVVSLPNLSHHTHLQKIVLDNTGIPFDDLDPAIRSIVTRYDL